jgi:hypothetical protein
MHDIFDERPRPKLTLHYPKKLGITKKQVFRERNKLYNPDVWNYSSTKTAHILKFDKIKARKKLHAGTFKSSYSREFDW